MENKSNCDSSDNKKENFMKKRTDSTKKKSYRVATQHLTPEMELFLPFSGGNVMKFKRRSPPNICQQTSSVDLLMRKYWPDPLWHETNSITVISTVTRVDNKMHQFGIMENPSISNI